MANLQVNSNLSTLRQVEFAALLASKLSLEWPERISDMLALGQRKGEG